MSDADRAKAKVCEEWGISPQQMERYFKLGMPYKKKGRLVYLPWPEARTWFFKYLEQKGFKRATPQTIDEARRRKATAEAEMAELELAKARDELMTVAAGQATIAEVFARVRARLLNLSPRVAGVIVGVGSRQEALARIEPLVLEVMAELHRGDDLPAPEPDEEGSDESEEEDDRTGDAALAGA